MGRGSEVEEDGSSEARDPEVVDDLGVLDGSD